MPARGPSRPRRPEDRDAYRLTQELRRRFEREMGALECRALTGMDLSTREGVKAFYASDVPANVCLPAVRTAYEITIELLAKRWSRASSAERLSLGRRRRVRATTIDAS